MKNVILISIIGAFLFFGPDQSFAQTQGQEKREEAKEKQDKAQDKREEADRKKADKASREKQAVLVKDKDNQGNAYGKDKGDMTGREFGQHRAEMARNKAEHAKTRLQETENLITFHRERLSTLKQSIEEEGRKPNANKIDIEEREIKIRRAEVRLSELEETLNESRERLRRAERSLESVISDN